MSKELTPKQQRFVEEYLIDLNATQAAIRAGYSAKTACWIGPQLLAKSRVRAAIEVERQKLSERTHVTLDRTVLEIARITFSDPRQLFNDQNAMIPPKQWSDNVAASIASIKILEVKGPDGEVVGETKEIKFWDKNSAAEKLMKHLGGYEKDNKQKSNPVDEFLSMLTGKVLGPSDDTG